MERDDHVSNEPARDRNARASAARSEAPGPDEALERRAGELLRDSAEHLDGHVRSRLAQARHAALEELERRGSRGLATWWAPGGAVAAAAVLAVALWAGGGVAPQPVGADLRAVEDLELLAAGDLELFGEELAFYEWAQHAAGASG